MANPSEVLKRVVSAKKPKDSICELVEKVFNTRNLLHFAHLTTKSYASHVALGDLYDDIIDDIDEITEVYMGKFGLLNDLECIACKRPSDIIKHIEDEAAWVEQNRTFIAKGYTPIENLIDNLLGHYSKTIYKLKNLK